MLSIFVGLFVLLSCFLLPIVLATNRMRRILRPVSGPEETFVLGHVQHFVNKTPSVIWKTVLRGFRECGKVFKMHLLNETLVFVSDPKIIEVSRFQNNIRQMCHREQKAFGVEIFGLCNL